MSREDLEDRARAASEALQAAQKALYVFDMANALTAWEQWHPVSEPPPLGAALMVYDSSHGFEVAFPNADGTWVPKSLAGMWMLDAPPKSPLLHVTHWRPLPFPPMRGEGLEVGE